MQTATADTPTHNHWVPLHQYAVENAKKWDKNTAKAFYQAWKSKIPNSNDCECKAKWKKLRLKPAYESAQAFFEWAWMAHNTVSERPEVNKPTLTLEQAYAQWWPSHKTT